MRGTTDETIAMYGVRETVLGFNRIQRGLGRVVTDELKKAAQPIADKAREIAIARGLVGDTENLTRKIKVFATSRAIGVRETATRKAGDGKRGGRYKGRFSYPLVYEFGDRGAGESIGPRAFMYPAAQWGAPFVEAQLAAALDRLINGGSGTFTKGPTGRDKAGRFTSGGVVST